MLSGVKLKESGIPLTIGIQHPSSTDKYWNPLESGILRMESRIQDCPGLPYMGAINCFFFFASGQAPPLPLSVAVGHPVLPNCFQAPYAHFGVKLVWFSRKLWKLTCISVFIVSVPSE